jgi:hypothetical protein
VRVAPTVIEGEPALWVYEAGAEQPAYAIVLTWRDGKLARIRDFRYARYVMPGQVTPGQVIPG